MTLKSVLRTFAVALCLSGAAAPFSPLQAGNGNGTVKVALQPSNSSARPSGQALLAAFTETPIGVSAHG